jgi:flagellar hook-associated protein 3 FlgL
MFTIQNSTYNFLANLSALENQINTTNRQVSSGLRVQNIADQPDANPVILDVNASIVRNDQIKNNLAEAQTEVTSAEDAVSTAATLMDQAVSVGAQGTGGSAINRNQLASQISDITNQMQQLALTQVSGRFIFSGDNDQNPPYGSVDFTANPTNGVGTYQGSNHLRTIEDPSSVKFSLGFTAQTVFDGGTSGTTSTSVFQSLTKLHDALLNGTAADINAAITNIGNATTYLNGIQAQYGDIQNKITNSQNTQSTFATSYQTQLQNLTEVDEATAILQQQQQSTALTAAETAFSALPKKSLFDYLG